MLNGKLESNSCGEKMLSTASASDPAEEIAKDWIEISSIYKKHKKS
jgi:hypothetical protein